MKKIMLTLAAVVFAITTFAQKTMPEIKVGTIFSSSAFVQGQEFPLLLTVKSIDGPVSIGWAVDGYGEGSFDMSKKAFDSANKMLQVTQPSLGATKLADDETFGLISKSAYKSLTENKTFTYSGVKFTLKTPALAFKLNAKEVDATNVISEDGKLELWILNNPNFPFILQSNGMPTDIVVLDIK
ncbi:hypothetical protein [Pedobacter cryotolerans]|uniref:DOMON domain-containing protein n=1 Tax=Pedobacter cryotolerans TaxID=2571270 RepID=A0A4U1C0S5_9SPHI|nr:hypothetical protein [Pedobacter cryotolerans]TKB96589.1 hypothetical protein FA045_17720 [Pedobacter cryotolerans]